MHIVILEAWTAPCKTYRRISDDASSRHGRLISGYYKYVIVVPRPDSNLHRIWKIKIDHTDTVVTKIVLKGKSG